MVDVIQAGFNVDSEVLKTLRLCEHSAYEAANQLREGDLDEKEQKRISLLLKGFTLQESFGSSDCVTPEVISAAYARISRFRAPVDKLREKARKEVPQARKSNRAIVFEMNHHSVAEHAYFNFDILKLSRLATESLQHHRLCSFTEKSQRYITLDGDYVIPTEYTDQEKDKFVKLMDAQVDFYNDVLPKLIAYQEKLNPEMAKGTKRERNTLQGWAKEDARYCLGLATEVQMGFSANARNLEHVIRRLRHNPLAENRELADKLYNEVVEIAPSLLIMASEEDFKEAKGFALQEQFMKEGEKDHREATRKLLESKGVKVENVPISTLKLLNNRKDFDDMIISSLISGSSGLSAVETELICKDLTREEKTNYVKEVLQSLGTYDALPRDFEMATLSFEAVMSSSCYAQFKRHRMMSQTVSDYDPAFGITVPPSVDEIDYSGKLKDIADQSAELSEDIKKNHQENPGCANYCLTNAHRRKVLFSANMRELYAFSRLRVDEHAQWDIRLLAKGITGITKNFAPITGSLLAGRGDFEEVKSEVYAK